MQKKSLTPKETEVFQLMLNGLSPQEIADKLVVTIQTIKTHSYSIFKKFKVKHRYELHTQIINDLNIQIVELKQQLEAERNRV